MASALLASRNEPCWGEGKVYMRKIPNPNPNSSNWRPNPNPNPTPNPNNRTNPYKSDESATISGDSSSQNRSGYVTFNISAFSRRELKDLKKRLVSELNQVRTLSNRIESRDFQSRSGYSATTGGAAAAGGGGGGREVTSSNDGRFAGSKRPPAALESVRPATDRLLTDMMSKCGQILTKMMRQKNCKIFNTPVDVVGLGLHDYNHIVKLPMDLGTVKSNLQRNLYASPVEFAADVRLTFNNALLYNPSGHYVYLFAQKLLSTFEDLFEPAFRSYEEERHRIVTWAEKMKHHKTSYVQPVVSSSKKKNIHSLNPPPPFPPLLKMADHRIRSEENEEIRERNGTRVTTSTSSVVEKKKKKRPPLPEMVPAPEAEPQVVAAAPVMRSGGVGKQPKPKAKDANKREMSFQEKHRLSMSLVELPQEKMDQVVHIIKKRNPLLAGQDDEIEVDIEAVDTETLWELDRFVVYYKKMVSKMKRQALVAAPNSDAPPPTTQNNYMTVEEEQLPEAAAAPPPSTSNKKLTRGENTTAGGGVEEEIDIGEDMPTNNFPPVEIEKDGGGYASRSSSSSSSSSSDDDSSSNSDSDSGSSSGSDSDVGDGMPSQGGRVVVESKAASPSPS